MADPVILASDVAFTVRGKPILSPMSASFSRGRFYALVGQSGAGKSTLLRLLSGEEAPSCGGVFLDGSPLGSLSPAHLSRRRAVLSQAHRLAFPFLVAEVVRLGLEAGGFTGGEAAYAAMTDELLTLVGLRGFERRSYNSLSGGEQQRVHMARVLGQVGPYGNAAGQVLLLDEPTSSLDLKHQIEILNLAADFAARGGLVLAVLHDINLASRFADEVIAIKAGRLVAHGAPEDVLCEAGICEIFDVALCVNRTPLCRRPFVLPFPARSEAAH